MRRPVGPSSRAAEEGSCVKLCCTRAAVLAVLACVVSQPAHAQLLPPTPDVTGSRVRLGPLWMNPSVSLTNVGVDTNLFNESETDNPRRDVAIALVPQSDLWMRAGRTWLSGSIRQDMIWFREYSDEGSTNGAYRAGWVVPLTRVSLLVDGHYVRAKERPGFEIDTRAQRREGALSAALEIRALSRTYLGASVEGRDVRFSTGSFFNGEDLRQQLNRRRTSGTVSVRHAMTPMTSLVVEGSGYEDRFAFASDRDARSIHAATGIKFDPAALIKGSVLVGWRRFTPSSPDIPTFTGTTAAATLSYVALASTRVTLEGVRDVEYSFDTTQPYYLLSGAAGTVTQRIAGPLDVQARLGYRTLAYRKRVSDASAPEDRRDRVTTVGGGLGYRLGRDLRLAFNIERQQRQSPITRRNYEGLRYGMSVTFGL